MRYKIIIEDGYLVRLEFRPDAVSSDGYYNDPLMRNLISEFPIPGWSYHKKEGTLSCAVSLPTLGSEVKLEAYSQMVKEAQDCITKLMDEAMRQQRIVRVLESLNR